MKNLQGKTALVTGASRGIGTYIAKALADQGMNLVLVARSADLLEKVKTGLSKTGVQIQTIAADLGQLDQLESLVLEAQRLSGGISVIVNNAGLEDAVPFDQADPEKIEQLIRVNLTAPILLSRLFLPKMIELGEGHIVNISSLGGLLSTPYGEAYGAAKHGLVGFTRCLRTTAIGEGYPVSASVICPGMISDAGMFHDACQKYDITPPTSFGAASPKEVANAVVQAILEDEPEVIVNPKPIKPILFMQLFFPKFATKMMVKGGILKTFKEVTYKRLGRDIANA